jgi:hypothetical protein
LRALARPAPDDRNGRGTAASTDSKEFWRLLDRARLCSSMQFGSELGEDVLFDDSGQRR